MILYAGFTLITEIELGYIALAVGWLVGKAIQKGSNGIGGRRYQITAVLLTYAAVSVAAIPIAIGIQLKHHQPLVHHQASAQAPGDVSAAPSAPVTKPNYFMLIVTLLGYGLASPVLGLKDPFHGAIGLIILLVGIRIAWRMTAVRPLEVDGPYETGPMPVMG
jgi:hypothetical protein